MWVVFIESLSCKLICCEITGTKKKKKKKKKKKISHKKSNLRKKNKQK